MKNWITCHNAIFYNDVKTYNKLFNSWFGWKILPQHSPKLIIYNYRLNIRMNATNVFVFCSSTTQTAKILKATNL